MLVNCRIKIIYRDRKGTFKSCKTGIFRDELLFQVADRYFRVKYQLSRLLLENRGYIELCNAKSHAAKYYFGCQGLWRQAVQFHSWQSRQQ